MEVEREVRPKGKLWITGNDVPSGADDALRSRARVVPFTRTFPESPQFRSRVLPSLREAALAKIVQAAGEYLRRGRLLAAPKRASDARDETMRDPFLDWLHNTRPWARRHVRNSSTKLGCGTRAVASIQRHQQPPAKRWRPMPLGFLGSEPKPASCTAT